VTRLKVFVCAPISNARLTRDSCGRRHTEARAKGQKGKMALITGTCAGCAVGAAHARGETPQRWPDGRKVRELALEALTGTERVAPSA
jgi:hypothetical protein